MRISAGLAAVLMVAGEAAQAQDARASSPLPSFPQIYETADLKIRVEKVADGLANPWSLAWLPNGDLLITERPGRLRLFRNGTLDPEPIYHPLGVLQAFRARGPVRHPYPDDVPGAKGLR